METVFFNLFIQNVIVGVARQAKTSLLTIAYDRPIIHKFCNSLGNCTQIFIWIEYETEWVLCVNGPNGLKALQTGTTGSTSTTKIKGARPNVGPSIWTKHWCWHWMGIYFAKWCYWWIQLEPNVYRFNILSVAFLFPAKSIGERAGRANC